MTNNKFSKYLISIFIAIAIAEKETMLSLIVVLLTLLAMLIDNKTRKEALSTFEYIADILGIQLNNNPRQNKKASASSNWLRKPSDADNFRTKK